MMQQRDITTPQTIAGSQIHEEEAQKILNKVGPLKKIKVESLLDAMMHSYRNLIYALRARKILANSEKHVLFRCIVPELGYVGLPDIANCKNGKQPILFEIKTTGRIPTEVWMDHKIQMGTYLIGLERLSFKPEYGVVEYILRSNRSFRKEFKVHINDSLKQIVNRTSKEVMNILRGKDPVPCNNPRKCASCGYKNLCPWSLEK